MTEVQNAAVTHWLDWIELEGIDPSFLIEGTAFTLPQLRDPRGTMSWNDYTVLLRRFTAWAGGPRALAEITRSFVRHSSGDPLRSLSWALGHPSRVYGAIQSFIGPQLFPCIESSLHRQSDLELFFDLRIPADLNDAPEWFHGARGALSEAATLCDWPQAVVRLQVKPRHGHYHITLRPPAWALSHSLSARLAKRFTKRRWLSRAAENIARQQAELQGSYRALSRANLHMQHLAERERRLARVGRRLAEQVELAPLLDTLCAVCVDELGYSGIAVRLHGPPPVEHTQGTLGPRPVRHLLRRSHRELGTLQVPAGPAPGDELLSRLLPWIALAIDNALHFEVATANRRALQAQLHVQAHTTAALERSQARWQGLVSSIPDVIVTIDPDYRVTFVNRPRFGFMHPDEVVGVDIRTFAGPSTGFSGRLEKVFAEGVTVHHDAEWPCPDGQTRFLSYELGPVVQNGEVTAAVLVVRDQTERRQAELEHRELERRVLEKQKLESLGVLAGGIAHDFNNLLMGITANAELAELHLPATHPARPFVERIETAGARAGELTRQMLTYAGRRTVRPEHMDLNALVRDLGDLLQAALPKHVRLIWSLQTDLPAVKADPAQLQQVVLNVLKNAADAIGDDAGTVTLRTRVEPLTGEARGTPRKEAGIEGNFVVIEISDTGCGMTPDVQRRIFDPFFSTNATGRGLGLAAVLGIVRAHHGLVEVHSSPQQGTTFQVYLPALADPPPRPPPRPRDEPNRLADRVVLVVDDEPVVRQVAADLLRHHGAVVMTAPDGADALRHFAAHPEINVVLLDLTMPGPGGDEVFAAMRELRPDARILLTSGYDARDAVSRLQALGLAGFLRKPWDRRSLVDMVARVAADEPPIEPGAPPTPGSDSTALPAPEPASGLSTEA